jgi:hypothetical protein
MFTQEHVKLALTGLTVQDGLTILQIVRRLVKSGVMEDLELAPVTEIRTKLVQQIQDVSGVNYDVAFAQAMQMGPQAAAAAAALTPPKSPAAGANGTARA